MLRHPIFHVSIPVRDLATGIAFYTEILPGTLGRDHGDGVDIALFGAQLTLQDDPQAVSEHMPRTRHFGATLDWDAWTALVAALGERIDFAEPPSVRHRGSAREQAKAMIADPSGNLIELKAYRHPERVLGPLAALTARASRCMHIVILLRICYIIVESAGLRPLGWSLEKV